MKKNLTICYFGTYRQSYCRNVNLITGLRLNGVKVIECHQELWHGVEDRVEITSGGWFSLQFFYRVVTTYIKLFYKFVKIPEFDILMVGYPGQFDIYLAKFLNTFKRKPLVWDVLNSLYLISIERGLDKRSKFTVNMIKTIEKKALSIPDLLIHDTEEYVKWICETYDFDQSKFRIVPLGADDRIFKPLPGCTKDKRQFIVTYHGSYIPNHGTEYILEAARILKTKKEINFEMIGDGPERKKNIIFSKKNNLTNITFIEWLSHEDLVNELNCSDIILGAFGSRPQSLKTVHNKIFEGLAIRKPVVTGNTPAVNQAFKAGEEIFLCDHSSSESLANAILTLLDNPELRKDLSENGHRAFINSYTLEKIGHKLLNHLSDFFIEDL